MIVQLLQAGRSKSVYKCDIIRSLRGDDSFDLFDNLREPPYDVDVEQNREQHVWTLHLDRHHLSLLPVLNFEYEHSDG